jgi:hypothetical protein
MNGAIPPFPQYAFMAWCLVKHRDNVTFIFYLYRQCKFTSFYILSARPTDADVHIHVTMQRNVLRILALRSTQFPMQHITHSVIRYPLSCISTVARVTSVMKWWGLVNTVMNIGFHNRRVFSCLADWLQASQEGLCFMWLGGGSRL